MRGRLGVLQWRLRGRSYRRRIKKVCSLCRRNIHHRGGKRDGCRCLCRWKEGN